MSGRSIVDLSEGEQKGVAFLAAHTAVVYDPESKQQLLLQGHLNTINCLCGTGGPRLLTADSGEGALLVVWDITTGGPAETVALPGKGFAHMALSPDGNFLAALSASESGGGLGLGGEPQELSVWNMNALSDGPVVTGHFPPGDVQHFVAFNPENPEEVLTNGAQRTFFWSLNLDKGTPKYYSPPVNSEDFKQAIGVFTVSTFVPGTGQALTACDDGGVLMWEAPTGKSEKRASKVIRVHQSSINHISFQNGYVVTAGTDGNVRFFDAKMRIAAWFEDILDGEGGQILAVSFSGSLPQVVSASKKEFVVPDFMVATDTGRIISLSANMYGSLRREDRFGHVIHEAVPRDILHISSSRTDSDFVLALEGGLLQKWDLDSRQKLAEREFEKEGEVSALEYFPGGYLMAACFTDGTIAILNEDLEDVQILKMTSPVSRLVTSPCENYFVVADTTNVLAVVQLGPGKVADRWEVIGKYRAHACPIVSLMFTYAGEDLHLTSVGKDGTLEEFNISLSNQEKGIVLEKHDSLHKGDSEPVAAVVVSSREQPCSHESNILVTADTNCKFLTYNLTLGCTTKIVLGPAFGGQIQDMVLFNDSDSGRAFLLYAMDSRVAGMIAFPLDGDPEKSTGVIANSGDLAGIRLGYDNTCALVAGKRDGMVTLWALDTEAFDEAGTGATEEEKFGALVEGGVDGEFYSENIDYFYYTQLKAQGEDTILPRKITGKVPITELAALLRALGHYPSEDDIQVMLEDIKEQAAIQGKPVPEEIPLPQFLALFTNYRPVLGVNQDQIEQAFDDLGAGPDGMLSREDLIEVLRTQGEPMGEEEISKCLSVLCDVNSVNDLPKRISAKTFAEEILGFVEYE